MSADCLVRSMGIVDFARTASGMLAFTDSRQAHTADEIWLLQHFPVFSQGTSCRTLPRQNPDNIPVIHTSRGGQMTYHGPGQLIAYLLLDIKRLGLGPRTLITRIEQCVIDLLAMYGLTADRRVGAPGVYIDSAKIAALGMRIRNGKCFHGLSLNVEMDMKPYEWIDPCGIRGLEVTQLSAYCDNFSLPQVADDLLAALAAQFSWRNLAKISGPDIVPAEADPECQRQATDRDVIAR